MPETPALKPTKRISMQITVAPVRNQTKKGDPVASLRGREVGEGARGDKETKLALFDEPATRFLEAFEERASETGETPETFKPVIHFDGYWSKNEWTQSNGKTITTWEFRAKAFEFA